LDQQALAAAQQQQPPRAEADASAAAGTPIAEYDRLLLRGSLSAAERRLFVPALGPWLAIGGL
jgi:hypothetical protein